MICHYFSLPAVITSVSMVTLEAERVWRSKTRGYFLRIARAERKIESPSCETIRTKKILMLPKHRSECDLEQPFQRAYFDNEFGSRSIGEPNWKPHVRNALDNPDCQEHSPKGGNGLDWSSSIRCPQPVQQIKPTQSQSHLKRNDAKTPSISQVEQTTQEHQAKTQSAALEYNETQDYTRVWELTLEKSMGQKKKAWDCRNGVRERAPGDKSYHVPEYEEQFHSHGSTLPSARFCAVRTIPDTFIPLVKLPLKPRIPFHAKERRKEREKEICEVNELDHWKPAEQLRIS